MSESTTEQLLERIQAQVPDDPSEEIIEELAAQIADNIQLSDILNEDANIVDCLNSFESLKLNEVTSERAYSTKIEYIRTYFQAEVEATSTQDLTPADIRGFRNWRKYESLEREEPLANSTLKDDMYLFREFIDYLVSGGMLQYQMLRQIDIPKLDRQGGEGVSEKKLCPELAQSSLEYLRKYRYASVAHVAMEIFCASGSRRSGVHSLDVSNFDAESGDLHFVDYDGELKNDENSERSHSLPDEVIKIIEDYLKDKRPDVTDKDGRAPLLANKSGRVSISKVQNIVYEWTRPCKIGLECPHDRDPQTCEAAQRKNWAYKCPSSRAPHHIRTGFITDNRTNGVSREAIEARCDVSPRTQDIHYDLPNKEEQKERADTEFEAVTDDPNSGYQT